MGEVNGGNGIYCKQTDVNFYDCDLNKLARMSSIMKQIADIAGVDFTNRGFSHSFLMENNMVFLLSKVAVVQDRPIASGERITVKTFPRTPSGSTFIREVIFEDVSGTEILWATTSWLMVNPTTRRILRTKSFTDNYSIPCDDTTPTRSDMFNRIKYDEDRLQSVGTHKVCFSQIDGNNHMYNAFYSDVVYDFIPYSIAVKRVREYNITFKKEAVLGDVIEVYTYDNPDEFSCTVVGKIDEKVCFEAQIFYID